jgi:hypothetical protein
MNSGRRLALISSLIHTSVQDCETTLSHHDDPNLLCDLLIECHEKGHLSREQVVRRRIAKLIRGAR